MDERGNKEWSKMTEPERVLYVLEQDHKDREARRPRNAEAQRRFREAHAKRLNAARKVYNVLVRRARWLTRSYDLADALRACLTDDEIATLCAKLAAKAKKRGHTAIANQSPTRPTQAHRRPTTISQRAD